MKIHKKEGLVSFRNSKTRSNVINAVCDIELKDTCKNTKQTSTRTNNAHSNELSLNIQQSSTPKLPGLTSRLGAIRLSVQLLVSIRADKLFRTPLEHLSVDPLFSSATSLVRNSLHYMTSLLVSSVL